MDKLKVGDIVARKSYGCDIFFKVDGIKSGKTGNIALLKGIVHRIVADAPEEDLVIQPRQKVAEYMNENLAPGNKGNFKNI